MYKFFGYLNILLLLIILSPFFLRMINQKAVHSKSPKFLKVLKILRKLHKPAAVLFIINIAVHGWLALGTIAFHTGTVTAASFLITGIVGFLFYRMHKKGLIKAHRFLALFSIILLIMHLLFPWLFTRF